MPGQTETRQKPGTEQIFGGYNPRIMDWRAWFRPPRHLLVLFLGITVVSASALGWLSWQLVRQDRALASQRAQDQRDNAASLAITAFQKDLTGIEERLTALLALADADLSREAGAYAETLSPGSALVIFRPDGVEAYPRNALAYYPELPNPAFEARAFQDVDPIESREKNYPKAITALSRTVSGVRNSCDTADTKSDCSRATASSRATARAIR